MAILEKQAEVRQGDFVFAGRDGARAGRHTLRRALQQLRRPGLTVHGFRSTFRDWAAERTDFPSEVAEMALAHAVSDRVEAAYRRGDLFQKRRKLAEAWAQYCTAPVIAGEVVAIRAR